MSTGLTKDSIMECAMHGDSRPAFICKHLLSADKLGFFESDEPFDPEWPFKNAWCAECDKVLEQEGEWNDKSESFAGVIAICEGCYEEIKKRNKYY